MPIRCYQPGDESAQVEIYNHEAAALPGFKPAHVDEVARRYRTVDPDPKAKFYAVEENAIVGYAVFNPNGRISYPWCLPDAQAAREPLLEAVLAALRDRGQGEAWAAYREDWEPVLSFLRAHGFHRQCSMVNYVAELDQIPHVPVPEDRVIRPMERADLPRFLELGRGIIAGDDRATLEHHFWDNSFFDSSSLFGLSPVADAKTLLGAALVIDRADYADPARIDPAMPCFRLGALGTERQRHKRVNGLFSCIFGEESAGEALLSEAARRLERSGSTRIAAQVPSDQGRLLAFHDRFMRRQGSFPILSRRLT